MCRYALPVAYTYTLGRGDHFVQIASVFPKMCIINVCGLNNILFA